MWKISFRRRYAQTIRDGASSNCKVIFSHFILNIKKELFHIWNLHKKYMLNKIFFNILYCPKKWPKIDFFKLDFLWNQFDGEVFCVFTHKTPQKNLTTEWPVVEQRQDQHKVRRVWSIGVLLFLLRDIQMSTQVIWTHFTKNVKIRLIF